MSSADQLATELVDREAKLRGERATWDSTWQNIARYVLPNAASFTEEVSPGMERTRYILDSTAPRSLELFASFLHTLLNNPSSRWIRLGLRDAADDGTDIEARQWFEAVESLILEALAGEQSDIYSQLHMVYLDLGAFGTSTLFVDVAPGGSLRTRQYHMADCVIAEGESELIDTMLRQRTYSVRQAKQKWPGKELGNSVDKAKGKDEGVRFLHCVIPADDPCAEYFPPAQRENGAPYVQAWVNAADRKTIDVGTYEEFPYIVPRWYKSRGEVYGRSPAMTVLPDIRMVNRMSDTILRGAEKIVDPPLVIPDGGLVSPVRLFPGGITYSDGQIEPKTLIPPGTSRIETGNELLKQRQQSIREGFFTPLFISPDSPVKTATAVLQEVDERNRALSPMLVRVQSELFYALVRRVYNLLFRAGRLPPAPASIAGRPVKIEYVSPLVASQKQSEGLGLLRLFEGLAPWASIDKGVFDWFDPDKVAKYMHLASGSPAEVFRNRGAVDALREARKEIENAAAAQATMLQGGEVAAKMLAAAPKPSEG